MTLYLSLTIKTKGPVAEDLFTEKLGHAVGKSVMDQKTALANTMFDQKDDPDSLEDAISQAVIAERLGKSKIVYFLQFRSAEAYVFGGNLTKAAESAYKRLSYALKGMRCNCNLNPDRSIDAGCRYGRRHVS
jgi:hypothetical protein